MKKKAIIFTAIGLALAICAGVIIFAVFGKDSREIAKNLDLGNKYLTEQNYEEAVAAFNKVLEIDPMNVDAYVGLIDIDVTHASVIKGEDVEGAYDLLNNAKEIISRAQEATGDPIFDEKLSEIQKEIEAILVVLVDKAVQEGNDYLEEYEYEKAIERFKFALSLDESRPEIYLGLVEAYIEMNDFEAALEWAQKGYEATGSEELKQKIEMLESGNVVDARNRVHCEYYYGKEGESLGSIRYTYNKDKVDTLTRYSPNGEEAFSLKYEYNEEGKCVLGLESITIENPIAIHYSEKIYGKDGLVVTSKEYSEDGSICSLNSFEYNENGQLSKKEEDREDSVLIFTFIYDENGKNIREDQIIKHKDVGYESHTYYLFSYDSNGKMVEQTDYHENEYTGKSVYTYDEEGKMISRISYDSEGNVRHSVVSE